MSIDWGNEISIKSGGWGECYGWGLSPICTFKVLLFSNPGFGTSSREFHQQSGRTEWCGQILLRQYEAISFVVWLISIVSVFVEPLLAQQPNCSSLYTYKRSAFLLLPPVFLSNGSVLYVPITGLRWHDAIWLSSQLVLIEPNFASGV